MLGELLFTAGVALIAYSFYKISTNHAKYYEQRNLKHRGVWFTVRNFFAVFFGQIDVFGFTQGFYNQFPNEPIYGTFDFAHRQYFVRDPEAFKQIAIKGFDHFEDRRGFFDERVDELWGKSLLSLHGEKWRQMRATLSPAFTGSKMRQMFGLVTECADDIVKHFLGKAQNGEKINIEMKEFFSRYANDVIATCAFGISVNSFAEPENEFFMTGKSLMSFGGFNRSLRFLAGFLFPTFCRIFNIKFFDEKLSNSLKTIILDTMETRQKNDIHRPDMINIMMKVRQGNFKENNEEKAHELHDGFATVEESEVGQATVTRQWNDNEVVAQCLLFFLAGFDTSSSMLTFAAYELVASPDIQQKLYEEIAEVNEQINGKSISYETLQKMKYLDQVICETLRKWPAGVQIDRICVKNFNYDDGHRKFIIETGSCVNFSLYGIQNDPKYFPDPDKFDPERFSDENKHDILAGTYVPFGVGSRNCIGSRFALMELKAILYYLLLNFSFEVNADTQISLKMKKSAFVLTERGVHLELRPRIH